MFDKYFEVYLADDEESRSEHFQIRYKVYCEEMGFEDKNPHQKEMDKWDLSAVHFIVKHKYTDQWVGAMRLVSPLEGALPVTERVALEDEESMTIGASDVELSRLCLVKEIRRRQADSATPPVGDLSRGSADFYAHKQLANQADNIIPIFTDRRVNLSIIWGLFRAAADFSEQNNIKNWYFLTNKALARVIGREGFKLHRIGQACEHAGTRYPFKMKMEEIFAQVASSPIASSVQAKSYRRYSEYQQSLASAAVAHHLARA